MFEDDEELEREEDEGEHGPPSEEVEAAADRLNLTIDLLQGSADIDMKELAARKLDDLSKELRILFDLALSREEEQEKIFREKLNYHVARFAISGMSPHHLAHFTDKHLMMINGMTKDKISYIRRLLKEVHIEEDPDIERGILSTKMEHLWMPIEWTDKKKKRHRIYMHCPYDLADLTVREVREIGPDTIKSHFHLRTGHETNRFGKAYVDVLFRKLQKL